MDNEEFTYLISIESETDFPVNVAFGNLFVNVSENTSCMIREKGQNRIAIIGFCVDAEGVIPAEAIAEEALGRAGSSIAELIKFFNRCAGRYMVLYETQDFLYAFPDATAQLPVNYCVVGGKIYISSSDCVIGNKLNLPVSLLAEKIRQGATSLSQPLPYDITMYDAVKVLLPKRYLVFAAGKINVSHVQSNQGKKDFLTIDFVVKKSIDLIENIVRAYSLKYELVCPLTAGWDSRIVYLFLKRNNPRLQVYTLKHENMAFDSPDLVVPRRICDDSSTDYHVFQTEKATEEYYKRIKDVIGPYFSERTANIAYTMYSRLCSSCLLKGKPVAVVQGDIISFCKSYIGINLPGKYAVSSFFCAKLHNHSPLVKPLVKKWIKTVPTEEDLFDAFTIENRFGRWAAQSHSIYAVGGVCTLNIFNSQLLLDLWGKISREERNENVIQKKMIEQLAPELLSKYPINPNGKFACFEKNKYGNLFAVYVKYYIGYLRYFIKLFKCRFSHNAR